MAATNFKPENSRISADAKEYFDHLHRARDFDLKQSLIALLREELDESSPANQARAQTTEIQIDLIEARRHLDEIEQRVNQVSQEALTPPVSPRTSFDLENSCLTSSVKGLFQQLDRCKDRSDQQMLIDLIREELNSGSIPTSGTNYVNDRKAALQLLLRIEENLNSHSIEIRSTASSKRIVETHNRGVCATNNCCAYAATLYAMFKNTYAFDFLLVERDDCQDNALRLMLSEEIVKPLRETGFVSSDVIERFREMIQGDVTGNGSANPIREPGEFVPEIFTRLGYEDISINLGFEQGNSTEELMNNYVNGGATETEAELRRKSIKDILFITVPQQHNHRRIIKPSSTITINQEGKEITYRLRSGLSIGVGHYIAWVFDNHHGIFADNMGDRINGQTIAIERTMPRMVDFLRADDLTNFFEECQRRTEFEFKNEGRELEHYYYRFCRDHSHLIYERVDRFQDVTIPLRIESTTNPRETGEERGLIFDNPLGRIEAHINGQLSRNSDDLLTNHLAVLELALPGFKSGLVCGKYNELCKERYYNGVQPSDSEGTWQWPERNLHQHPGELREAVLSEMQKYVVNLPQQTRWDIYGQIWELAGKPTDQGDDFGKDQAFVDLGRLFQAIQNVAQ